MKQMLLLVLFAALALPSLAQSNHSEPPAQKPTSTAASVPSEPVKLDTEIQEVVRDMLRILREIRRVEAADGVVQIPESINLLRSQFNAKNDRLNKWVKEKNIPPDWKLDDKEMWFEPPGDKKPQ